MAARGRRLPDVLAPALRVLFVGINPSLESARVGHHFASPGNPFWRLLHAAGLTPEPLAAADDRRMLELGFGLTNVCPRPTRGAAELSGAEYARGVRDLVRKVEELRPEVVALVGVTLARSVLPGSAETGPGPRKATLGGARVFVLPNPSGRNAAFPGFEQKRVWFDALREYARVAPGSAGGARPPRPNRGVNQRPGRGRDALLPSCASGGSIMAGKLAAQDVKGKVGKLLSDAEGNLRWLQENVPRLFVGVLREDEEVLTALAVGLSRLRTERHLVLADRENELVVAQLDIPG